jgi:hypothetical protein
MRELSRIEVHNISGSFHLNIGQALAAICIGWFAGGPIGLGFALSGVVMAQGVNNLDEMWKTEMELAKKRIYKQ